MGVPAVPKLKDHHHRIAFLLALGKKPVEVARELGVSSARLSQLRVVDEFKDLVESYREQRDTIEFDAFKQVQTIRAAIEQMALEVIRDRLEEAPDDFSTRELLELQADAADRLGRSKVSRTESTSVNIDLADALADARRRELKLSASEVAPDPDAGGLVTSTPAEGPAPNQ